MNEVNVINVKTLCKSFPPQFIPHYDFAWNTVAFAFFQKKTNFNAISLAYRLYIVNNVFYVCIRLLPLLLLPLLVVTIDDN